MKPDESSLPASLAGDESLARAIAGAAPGRAREAQGELCKGLAPRVRLYGLRHLRDEQAAADLTQQVSLMTLESLRSGRLREPEKLVSFVMGTCRLMVRGWRRGAERRRRLLEQCGREQPRVEPFSVPKADTAHLAKCLQRLAERDRSVLVVTYHAEKTCGEAARLRDAPLTRSRGEVVWTEPTDSLRALGTIVLRMRLPAVSKEGERMLGEYTFNHTGSGTDFP